MSMGDCTECWDNPCTCGNDYMNWDEDKILQQIKMLERVMEEINLLPLTRMLTLN